MNIHAYLNFDGETETAMRFYAKALGGTLGEVYRFGGMPMPGVELTESQKNRISHVTLELPGGQKIMASDTMDGMGPPRTVGNHFSISVHPESRARAEQIFQALSEGGQVGMPLEDQMWGDYYGDLTDRFGVQWMVNFHDGGGA